MARDTNSFRNQAKRVGTRIATLVRSEPEPKPKPKPKAEKPTRVMGKTKAETAANLDAVKTRRASIPRAPLRKDAVPASATKNVATKAGAYPVYKKDSAQAGSFRSAFANARKAGKKEFTWNGRKYSTKVK